MSETSTDTAAAMRLRADPPRVTRISRKVIIGLITALAWTTPRMLECCPIPCGATVVPIYRRARRNGSE